MAHPKPLSARAQRFADLYTGPGAGVWAAREAGYGGDDRTLAVTASKLLRDERVRAAIEARGIRIEDGPRGRVRARRLSDDLETQPGAELDEPIDLDAPDAGELGDAQPIGVWIEVMNDEMALPSARNQAAAFVWKAQQAAQAATRDADPLGSLRSKVAEILARKRGRERGE